MLDIKYTIHTPSYTIFVTTYRSLRRNHREICQLSLGGRQIVREFLGELTDMLTEKQTNERVIFDPRRSVAMFNGRSRYFVRVYTVIELAATGK